MKGDVFIISKVFLSASRLGNLFSVKFFVNFSISSKMGKHFGNLQKLKGVIYYTLSPLELKPFVMLINPGFPNAIRRFFDAALPAVLPLSAAYLLYTWGTAEHKRTLRKNPDDYKDDV